MRMCMRASMRACSVSECERARARIYVSAFFYNLFFKVLNLLLAMTVICSNTPFIHMSYVELSCV